MLNSFYGLEMGKRALNAFRLGLQTVGHNVSNMKTEGYYVCHKQGERLFCCGGFRPGPEYHRVTVKLNVKVQKLQPDRKQIFSDNRDWKQTKKAKADVTVCPRTRQYVGPLHVLPDGGWLKFPPARC